MFLRIAARRWMWVVAASMAAEAGVRADLYREWRSLVSVLRDQERMANFFGGGARPASPLSSMVLSRAVRRGAWTGTRRGS